MSFNIHVQQSMIKIETTSQISPNISKYEVKIFNNGKLVSTAKATTDMNVGTSARKGMYRVVVIGYDAGGAQIGTQEEKTVTV